MAESWRKDENFAQKLIFDNLIMHELLLLLGNVPELRSEREFKFHNSAIAFALGSSSS